MRSKIKMATSGAITVGLFMQTLVFSLMAMRICRLNITTSACSAWLSIRCTFSQLSSHNLEDPLVLERLQGVWVALDGFVSL